MITLLCALLFTDPDAMLSAIQKERDPAIIERYRLTNDTRIHGVPALYHALAAGNAPLVEALASQTFSNEADDLLNATPLSWSLLYGRTDMALWLIDHGVSVDQQDPINGETPLIWAVRHRDKTFAEQLLARKARPEVRDAQGRDALYFAYHLVDPELVASLRRAGAEQTEAERLWAESVRFDRIEVIHLLLEAGPPPTTPVCPYFKWCDELENPKSLLQLARYLNRPAIEALLEKMPADSESSDREP
ncbi:Ankyrin repeat domain-containing protein [Sulfidibacter corallicola]|uniref:Ankyrin repeat domain-containing protein n=1 Tax=Sulfidibacter corallicola TaxID=2818388 RepID=A0A8A4TRU7_SULCO|nr:ankyrin repeat domain-containing protein [Sulfidibacter corallicola]QTD49265.1 ankyrin repeat domain-containing protein [Sulfidibacter corallicola]